MMLLGQKIKELRMECYKDNWPSNLVIDMKSCNFVNEKKLSKKPCMVSC